MLVWGPGSVWGELVRGPLGYGVINDAGKSFSLFSLSIGPLLCNMWFVKKAMHQQTWQHPKSKQWSCIDYVIMSQSGRRMCLDIAVKRGAECNTDHQFVCVKIRLAGECHRRKKMAGNDERRHDVSVSEWWQSWGWEQPGFEARVSEAGSRESRASWPAEGELDEKWTAVSGALIE